MKYLVLVLLFLTSQKSFATQGIVFNPLIEKILADIDKDSCNKFLRDLCDMYTRDASNTQWNKGVLVPYLETKFEEYGCDSIYTVPVKQYDAPAVVGVRKGDKNPDVKNFFIIGAHPDNTLNSGSGRAHGANDNASGCVGFLEACRIMQDYSFENTIVFAAFNCEEHGLKGSAELFKIFKEEKCTISGAIAYDMLGIRPNSTSSIMFDYYSGIPGCKEFAENIIALSDTYNATPYTVNIEAASTINIPTDGANIWLNDFIGVAGLGGSGQGSIHTIADSIGDLFDSTHLAKMVGPGIATVAHHAVPFEQVGIETPNSVSFSSEQDIYICNNSLGLYSIRYKPEKNMGSVTISIYNSTGKTITRISPQKQYDGSYEAQLDVRNGSENTTFNSGLFLVKLTSRSETFITKLLIMQ